MKKKSSKPGSVNCEIPIFDLGDIECAVDYASRSEQARVPRSRIGGPRIIVFPSLKAREHAERYSRFTLEGRPEGYAALRFEFDSHIKTYGPQPFALRFFDGKKIAHYTSDFLLFYTDGRTAIVEIKPPLAFMQSHVRARLAIIEVGCHAAGIEFIRLTAKELEQRPRLDNLLFLYPYLAQPAPQLESLIDILRRAGRPLPHENILQINPLITPADVAAGLAGGHIFASHRFHWGPKFNLSVGAQR